MLSNTFYQSVTNKVIAALEAGSPPWVKPWDGTPMLPCNAITGRPYSGINTLILWMSAQQGAYPSQGWLTFKQAKEIGATVRKGEKGTPISFVKRVERQEGDERTTPVLRTFWVFNTAQVENLPAAYVSQPPEARGEETFDAALQFTRDCGIAISYGADQACYYPRRDEIHMPAYGRFHDDQAFFGTLFHELVHATGHKNRLDRDCGRRFGDAKYAFEELVAELGSAFLCARYGYPAEHRSASYVDAWLKGLKQDKRAIFYAAAYASKGADYLVQTAERAVSEQATETGRKLETAE